MTVTPLMTLAGVGLSFGGDTLFDDASLIIAPRARIALVGRNGSGKSTLLKIVAGLTEPDRGERFLKPGVAVRYLPQEPDLSAYDTTSDYVEAGVTSPADAHEARLLLAELGVDPHAAPDALSGGEARRAAIVRALTGAPDILLLDEPTNHLDLPAIAWLEARLKASNAALVTISHDRRFLEELTNETVWIDNGKTRRFTEGFAKFEAWRDKILEEEKLAHHKLGRKIAAEEDWMRYGVTARRKRNMRRVGELKALRKDWRENRPTDRSIVMTGPDVKASGKRIIKAEKISKSFGERTIIKDFSIEIARGEKVGIVAPNGAGKTTLLHLLTGALAPDAGNVTLGAGVDLISLDQRRDALKPDMRLADAITDGRGDWVTVGDTKKHVSSYLQDFQFAPAQWRSPVKALSGGERGRLALASALAKPANLMVLDEPTNDLDLETLDLLEELLSDFSGALLLVSHDRSFVDRIAGSIVTTDPDRAGAWRRYVGGYDDMVAQRGAPPGIDISRLRTKPRKPKPVEMTQTPPAKTGAAKLSYKDKYALENLPGEIDALEGEIAALKEKLDDPNLFTTAPEEFQKAAAALEKAEARLAAAEEEWLTLEMKREALET